MTIEQMIRTLNSLPPNAQAAFLEDQLRGLREALETIAVLPLTDGPMTVALANWVDTATQTAKKALG